MKGIWTIALKDARSLFTSPLFYWVVGVCALIWSGFFSIQVKDFAEKSSMNMNQMGGEGISIYYAVFASHVSIVNFIMLLATPAFTMRLFAEEKKQRTFDLLLTSPITATQITLGKFLGGLMTCLGVVLISAINPFLTAAILKTDFLPLVSSYLGLMFVVSCYVGVGMLASSLTESSFLAVVMAVLGNIILWFIGSFLSSGEGQLWQDLQAQLALGNHLHNFILGKIQILSLAYFLSVIGFLVFITQRVVESHRWR